MTRIVWCQICSRKFPTHSICQSVPPHQATWDPDLPCPGSGRRGLEGLR